jgi:hypothetical protein
MKFILLIYQGNTPLPGSDGWKALPEVEQRRSMQITPRSRRRRV